MKTKNDVQAFVLDEMRTVLALFESECVLESELEEVGCDSLDLVELAMEIESEFDVEVDDDALAKCKTIGDIVEMTWALVVR